MAIDARRPIATCDRHEHALDRLRDAWVDRGTGRLAESDRPCAVLPSLDGSPALFHHAGWL